ncbi:AAA family ATPase [Paracoccus sp. p1-h21]|uniref:AAA family ATPase n=1 Tax=Paracoccus sp. p1-h21 TaxID=3366951 RepID=UPI0037957C5A
MKDFSTDLSALLGQTPPETENAAAAGPRNGADSSSAALEIACNEYTESSLENQPLDATNCALIGAGASLHWLVKGQKRPVAANWSTLPNQTESDLRRSYSQGQNIGIRLGQPSRMDGLYLHLIDLDIRDPDKAGEAWSKLLDLWPDARTFPSVISGSGGESRHIYFLSPDAMPKRKIAKSQGFTMVFDQRLNREVKKYDWEIDLMGTGSQAALPPSIHPDTKQPYRWERPLELALPFLMHIDRESLDRFGIRQHQGGGEPFEPLDEVNPEHLAQALASLNVDDRDDWLKAGMALHHQFGGSKEGFGKWCDWAKASAKFNAKDSRIVWRSFKSDKPNAKGLRSLFREAGIDGYDWGVFVSDDDFDDLNDDSRSPFDGPKPKPSTLTFLTPDECEASSARKYLIKGLLAERDVACIFGAPGAGKSLIAPFLGYMVAQGQEAFKMRTKAGGVFYVASEDSHGMRGRVKALRKAHGGADAFKLVEGVSNLLIKESPDFLALKEAVKAERPALIFIDTLAMAFPGLEENSAEAMGRVVTVARALTRWGAAVVLIHHDTKAETGTPRGHSILNGALDVALHVKRDDEQRIIRGKLTKNRNGTCDRDIAFNIATDDFGFDDDGDPLTYPRCNPLVGIPAKVKRLPPQAAAALKILEDMAQPVSRDDWKRACMASDTVCAHDDPATRRKAFNRSLETLARDGLVMGHDGFYSIRDGFDDAPSHDDETGRTGT